MKSRMALTLLAFLTVSSAAHGVVYWDVYENLDHLRCYPIEDSLKPQKYTADLTNMFGVAAGCKIRMPARFFCTQTEKRITGRPLPPEGGPSGTNAGHFLCYRATCPDDPAPEPLVLEDQFGKRKITPDRGKFVCAPADPEQCGDGEIDPGEQCDGDESLCTVNDCNDDCTCNFPNCCQCDDMCYEAAFCPTTCGFVLNGSCGADGQCQRPEPDCLCGTGCTTDNGTAGTCRPPESDPNGECRCQDLPITGNPGGGQ